MIGNVYFSKLKMLKRTLADAHKVAPDLMEEVEVPTHDNKNKRTYMMKIDYPSVIEIIEHDIDWLQQNNRLQDDIDLDKFAMDRFNRFYRWGKKSQTEAWRRLTF